MLTQRDAWWAMYEALDQYVENGRTCDEEITQEQLRRLEAAEIMLDRFTEQLVLLAE